MRYAEELHKASESAAFAVEELTYALKDDNCPPLLAFALRAELANARRLSDALNELHTIIEAQQ